MISFFGFVYYTSNSFLKFFHGLNDVLNVKKSANDELLDYESWTYVIGFTEIISNKQIKLFGIENRKCRFSHEITSEASYPYGFYTPNFCFMECRIKTAIEMCGCRPFFYQTGNNSLYIET